MIDETKNVAWNKRQKKSKIENSGIPEEQLNQIQQDLFAKVASHATHFKIHNAVEKTINNKIIQKKLPKQKP